MEQYELPPSRWFKNIQKALKRYRVERVYIRFVGSQGGKVQVSEDMKNRILTISRRGKGLDIEIDGERIFFWKVTESNNIIFGNRWSIAYERFDDDGCMHYAQSGYPNPPAPYTGPNDSSLPKIKNTIFRSCNRNYLIEITFSGKIPIKKIGQIPGRNSQYACDMYWEIDS